MRVVLLLDGVQELLPQIVFDEEGTAQRQAGHLLVPQRQCRYGMAAKGAKGFRRRRGEVRAGLELVTLTVGAHGVHARDFPVFDEFERTCQRHVMELHPALEDVRRAEDHANRCGHDRRATKHFIDDGPVTLDLVRTGLVQGKSPLLRDDRAQIPKRNEQRAAASVARGRGVVLRVAEGDAVEAKGHGAADEHGFGGLTARLTGRARGHHTTCTGSQGNGTGGPRHARHGGMPRSQPKRPATRAGRTNHPGSTLTPAAQRCRRKFLRFFPGGYRDETYVDWERGYKWTAHERWQAELGPAQLGELLAAERFDELARRAVSIESRTNLLFSFEKMALRDAVRSSAGAERFSTGLRDLLSGRGNDEERFERWIETIAALPRRQTRVLTWPLVTVFGFIAQPDRHIFLKPNVTREAARKYEFDFEYQSRPRWSTYASLLAFADRVRRDTLDLRPRDMIDLQSFIWVQGSDEY